MASSPERSARAPTITVVMATYNGARFIEAQLASILDQLSADDEVVVCDDASTDDTAERVRRLSDPRIRLFCHSDRVGYVANFERAIRHARGLYVFFSDQDDVWLSGKVDKLMLLLEQRLCAASDAVVVDESLNVLFPSFFAQRRAERFSAWSLFLRPAIVGATMACHRPFVESLLPFPKGVPHDVWLSCNAALRRTLVVSREALILYRRHDAAVSPSATARSRPVIDRLADRYALLLALAARGTRVLINKSEQAPSRSGK